MNPDYKEAGFTRVMEDGREILYITPRIYAGPMAKATTRYEIIDKAILNIRKSLIYNTPNNFLLNKVERITLSEDNIKKGAGIRNVIFKGASESDYVWENVPNAVGVVRYIEQLLVGIGSNQQTRRNEGKEQEPQGNEEINQEPSSPVMSEVSEAPIGVVTEEEIAANKGKVETVLDNVLQAVAPSFANYRKILGIQKVALSKINAGEWDPPPFTKEEKRLIGYVDGFLGSPYKYYRQFQEGKAAEDFVYVKDSLRHLRDARKILNSDAKVRKRVEHSAKIERIVLNALLEEENAPLRTFLDIKGSCLADFDVEPGFFAGPSSDLYVKLVNSIVSRVHKLTNGSNRITIEEAVDWVLFCVPAMLGQIRKVFEGSNSNYDKDSAFSNIPDKFPEYKELRNDMETHHAWLQQRREEASRDFEQAIGKDSANSEGLGNEKEAGKKAVYQAERQKFGFDPTETFTAKELRYRYDQATEITDSKAEQKILDAAYQTLLKIAL